MTESTILQLAKQGDPDAIATLMNRSLQPKGMTAKAERVDDSLHVLLEADQVPNRSALTAFVQAGLQRLGVSSIHSVTVLGKQISADEPAWSQEIELLPAEPTATGSTTASVTQPIVPPPPRPAPPPLPPNPNVINALIDFDRPAHAPISEDVSEPVDYSLTADRPSEQLVSDGSTDADAIASYQDDVYRETITPDDQLLNMETVDEPPVGALPDYQPITVGLPTATPDDVAIADAGEDLPDEDVELIDATAPEEVAVEQQFPTPEHVVVPPVEFDNGLQEEYTTSEQGQPYVDEGVNYVDEDDYPLAADGAIEPPLYEEPPVGGDGYPDGAVIPVEEAELDELEEEEEEESRSNLLWGVLALVAALVFGILGVSLFDNWNQGDAPIAESPTPEAPTPDPNASSPPPSPVASPQVSPTIGPFEAAQATANEATQLSERAQSTDDWNLVASRWQEAIALAQQVPQDSPNYAAAQQNLATYQAQLATAQQQAANPPAAETPPPTTTTTIAGGIACQEVATRPESQAIELTSVQLQSAEGGSSSIAGCVTNHTSQPISNVSLSYIASSTEAGSSPTGRLVGILSSPLQPQQTIPFQISGDLPTTVSTVNVESIFWTPEGSNEPQRLSSAISLTR